MGRSPLQEGGAPTGRERVVGPIRASARFVTLLSTHLRYSPLHLNDNVLKQKYALPVMAEITY